MSLSQNLALPIHPTRRHPLTGRPIRALGVRRDGRLIWPIMGGDETAGQNSGGSTGGTGDGGGQTGGQGTGDGGQSGQQQTGGTGGQQSGAGDATGQQAGQQQGQEAGQQGQTAEKVEDLPEWAQRTIRDLRKESGDRRAQATTAETERQKLLDGIATALGIKPEGAQTPKPEELTQQLTAAQAAQRQTAVELAVYRTASKHQGDPDALLDSRSFLDTVKDLDPTANDFAAKVDTAIKTAVEANQKLKAGRAPGASSVDHAGGPGETRRTSSKPLSLDQAVTQHYQTT